MNKRINIAIDGPAGAGKSTVAKMVAEEISFIYVDTGAMYRALTWYALQNDCNVDDEPGLVNLLKKTDIQLINQGGVLHIYLNKQDVTEEIRSSEVTGQVSYVAKHGEIRKEMVAKQQQLALAGGTVMDGRDIGTAVLPHAELKIFLTATVEERATRRHEELVSKGIKSDYLSLKKQIAQRDKLDSEREVAPLKKASDAIEIDSTSMTINEVVEAINALIDKGDYNVE
ncbi:cytidylate kinase [Salipaludibacillus neizhouensis]|uniref:Cytidylate kinase n=1 Tax=Salipaludibacillus neizhouensis TaxID=885475 RepID=A0A3A9KAW6_9BACI|nr:(d)CMP kinase [Salipaludibacillus neizhouensis]RKL67611.1 cytidylate kinase [Salipaludibacillus neizhouensis]